MTHGANLFIMNATRATISRRRPSTTLSKTFTILFPRQRITISSITNAKRTGLDRGTTTSNLVIVPYVVKILRLNINKDILCVRPLRNNRNATTGRQQGLTTPRVPRGVLSTLTNDTTFQYVMTPTNTNVTMIRRYTTKMMTTLGTLRNGNTTTNRKRDTVMRRITILGIMRTTLYVRGFRVLLRFFTLTRKLRRLIRRRLFVQIRYNQINKIRHKGQNVPRQVLLFTSLCHILSPISTTRVVSLLRLRIQITISSVTLRLRRRGTSNLIRRNATIRRSPNMKTTNHVNVERPSKGVVVTMRLLNRTLRVTRISTMTILRRSIIVVDRHNLRRHTSTSKTTHDNARPCCVIITPLSVRVIITRRRVRSSVQT